MNKDSILITIHTRNIHSEDGTWSIRAKDGTRSIEREFSDRTTGWLTAHIRVAQELLSQTDADRLHSTELHDGSWFHTFLVS